ncbi:serine/threonine protein phosphatase, putative [Eimeria maxima]|uniref:Serine/threonine-protein phosphatase T n=1 Tax=Eimeria maxima TaxID=5804 RepID=U6M192_EIMMA|nr:serine/threonine protein phosphatase, putative [Eimeria maxima]CDJ56858.1 serine/threonine protein phosphatase, putative [Eimeria maxima]
MAEGTDSAGISGNTADSLDKEGAKRRDSEMAVDGRTSCPTKDDGDVAECDGKNDAPPGCSPVEKAEALKTEGNELFKQHQYAEAVSKYSAAIDTIDESPLDPKETQLHVYLCNRSFAHLRMENFGSAIIDAERALELNPKFSKGYYRRGTGYFCLGNLKAAQRDFERVCQLRGGKDADALSRLNECKKQLRAQAFAAAIRTKQTIPTSKQVLAEGLEKLFPVTADYTGPVYEKGKVDAKFLESLCSWLRSPENRLHPQYAYAMAVDFIDILEPLPSLVNLEIPADKEITVCGDVHGQFYDLMHIFEINGMPSEDNPYLFNGDIVDRGSFSVEVLLTMVACKLAYPNHMHITRGNHETSEMNAMYGFKGEMLYKYDERLYQIFSEAFRLLPLAFVVNNKAFVVHGGLSRQKDVTLDDIRKIDRNKEPGSDVLMTDLLWSDPSDAPGLTPSKRGVACQFGPDITAKFLKDNNLSFVIRSHEMKEEGYQVDHDGKLITVFSAPNYCDEMGNKGAFIRLNGSEMKPKFHQFTAVSHPPGPAMKYANPMLSLI